MTIEKLMTFEEKIEFLEQKLKVYVENLGLEYNSTFINHGLDVSGFLAKNSAPSYLVDAGLFHNAYGEAPYYSHALIERPEVEKAIGKQGEEVVYHYCITPPPRRKKIMDMEKSQLRTDLLMLSEADQRYSVAKPED